VYILPSVGIGVGASQRHEVAFNVHEAKGFGGMNASLAASNLKPMPAKFLRNGVPPRVCTPPTVLYEVFFQVPPRPKSSARNF
jgi:hypothetical protein